jgi:hypothetical protein
MTTATLTLSTLPFEAGVRLPASIGGMVRVCNKEETFNTLISGLIEKYGDAPVTETHWSKYDYNISFTRSKRYYRIESSQLQADREAKDRCVANYYSKLDYKGD